MADNFELILNPVSQLSEYYSKKPVLQALAKLLPYGSSLDTLLNTRAKEIATDRAKVFFDEINERDLELTPEIIESEDFIHRYVITAKAAINTHRREKIRLFARMLKASFSHGTVQNSDEYEEYLRLFDEMSYREFLVLTILERYENKYPFNGSIPPNTDYRDEQEYKDLKRAEQFWNEFLSEVCQSLNITLDETRELLNRLTKSGCYQKLVVHYTFTNIHEEGKLTESYFRIKNLVDEPSEDTD